MDRQTWDSESTAISSIQGQSPAYWDEVRRQSHHAAQAPQVVEQFAQSDTAKSPVLSSITSAIGSPRGESAWGADDAEKEVVAGPEPPASARKNRICGMRRRWFLAFVILLLLVVIGIGAGLGVYFGTKHKSSPPSAVTSSSPTPTDSPINPTGDPDYNIGGVLSPSYYTTEGAFNGSGIALAYQSFDNGGYGSMVMYFQHHTGQIRWQRLSEEGPWLGGTPSETVAFDAKNGTPIAAVAYSLNETSTWHIFYIDTDNYIRQKSNSNRTNIWADGDVNSLNLKANDADSVGLQACWYGSFYNDTDYTNSDSLSSESQEVGMHLWYASDSSTFQQYGWRQGDSDWQFQEEWKNKNGHAGVGCYSWGPGSVTYTMMVNQDNAVEVWWKDTNSSIRANNSHPINEWTKSDVLIPDVHPSTSLGYTNFLYAQMADSHVLNGYNISWAAENTAIVGADNMTVMGDSHPGIPGTHFSVSTIPNHSGGDSLIVFYQTEGDDITEFTRDMTQGQWTSLDLPIPNE